MADKLNGFGSALPKSNYDSDIGANLANGFGNPNELKKEHADRNEKKSFNTSFDSKMVFIDAEEVNIKMYKNVGIGYRQLELAITKINKLKDSVNNEIWEGQSQIAYKTYLENYAKYLEQLKTVLKITSDKVITGADKMQEIDALLAKNISGMEDWKVSNGKR